MKQSTANRLLDLQRGPAPFPGPRVTPDMLIDAKHTDAIEPARIIDELATSFGEDGERAPSG